MSATDYILKGSIGKRLQYPSKSRLNPRRDGCGSGHSCFLEEESQIQGEPDNRKPKQMSVMQMHRMIERRSQCLSEIPGENGTQDRRDAKG